MTTVICSYENIRQITSCTVCNRTFKDPRILPCGHTFYIDCRRNIMLDTTIMPFFRYKCYLITDNHKLTILDEDSHKVEVIGSNKSSKGQNMFNNPTGITIDDDDSEIILCDTNNDHLVVISRDLKWI